MQSISIFLDIIKVVGEKVLISLELMGCVR